MARKKGKKNSNFIIILSILLLALSAVTTYYFYVKTTFAPDDSSAMYVSNMMIPRTCDAAPTIFVSGSVSRKSINSGSTLQLNCKYNVTSQDAKLVYAIAQGFTCVRRVVKTSLTTVPTTTTFDCKAGSKLGTFVLGCGIQGRITPTYGADLIAGNPSCQIDDTHLLENVKINGATSTCVFPAFLSSSKSLLPIISRPPDLTQESDGFSETIISPPNPSTLKKYSVVCKYGVKKNLNYSSSVSVVGTNATCTRISSNPYNQSNATYTCTMLDATTTPSFSCVFKATTIPDGTTSYKTCKRVDLVK